MNPLVSVIVPVYNTSKYLRQCLESILSQTLKEIEIICVDDGSTDDSLDILNEYKQKDSRIIVLQQKNKGGGAARNLGLTIAQGKYLSFLDSDDFFELTMLEEVVSVAEKTNADITVFQYRLYYDSLNLTSKRILGLSLRNIMENMIISHESAYDDIFSFTPTCPWNKLFRHAFILANGLQFQEVKKCNDVYFVLSSLYLAEKIGVLQRPLVYYRTGTYKNTQATTFEHPLDVYYAFSAVQERLSITDDWMLGEKCFVNEALHHIISQLRKLENKHEREHRRLLQLLLDEGFDTLRISRYKKSDYQNTFDYRRYLRYKKMSAAPHESHQTWPISQFLETIYSAENIVCYIKNEIKYHGLPRTIMETLYLIYEKVKYVSQIK